MIRFDIVKSLRPTFTTDFEGQVFQIKSLGGHFYVIFHKNRILFLLGEKTIYQAKLFRNLHITQWSKKGKIVQ